MTGFDLVVVGVAGLAAGAVNAIAGGGSLISFPVLVAVGLPPLHANVSNTVGMVPGYFGGVVAYRRELSGQSLRGGAACLGALIGAMVGSGLLLLTSASVFETIVPFLILGAASLLALQGPGIRMIRGQGANHANGYVSAIVAGWASGIWGAYFNAALGVVILALFGLLVPDVLQRTNALKGLVSLVISGSAMIIFLFLAPVNLAVAGVLAVSSLVGGHMGGRFARRLPEGALRVTVVLVGLAAAIYLFVVA